MQVNVSNLKSNFNTFNRMLSRLEEDCYDFYNELTFTSYYWNDPHAEAFFDEVRLNYRKMQTMLEEYTSLQEVYQYFVEKYENIGNKVFFVLEKKNNCIDKINTIITNINSIISSYNFLDVSFCSSETRSLGNEKQKLKKCVTMLQDYKNDFRKKMDMIEDIEKNIRHKLSKIDITVLKEIDINDFVGD